MPYSNYVMHGTGTCNGHLLNGTQIWENFVNWGDVVKQSRFRYKSGIRFGQCENV